MPNQFEDSVASSNEVRKIVSEEVRPLLDKISELVEKLERYHQHDVEFQQKFLLLVSEMFRNQQISMDAFDKLDAFMRQEFFWGQQKHKET
jgi:hypothetical protein